jgi:hypothetical protein
MMPSQTAPEVPIDYDDFADAQLSSTDVGKGRSV